MVLALFTLLLGSFSFSQTGSSVEYISTEDRELAINNVAVVKVVDNVNGIYSAPLTELLKKKIEVDNQWGHMIVEKNMDSDYLSEKEIQTLLKDLKVEAVISSRVLRGPQRLNMRMTLFVGPSGKPLIQESKQFPKSDALEDVKREFARMYDVIHSRLPYDGVILSRRGQDVTLNIGNNFKLRAGQKIDAIQILQVERHPKHQFMTGSEKTILGKIVILKADDSLSFGRILFEKESGVIRPGNKIITQRIVQYPTGDELLKDPSFGVQPGEWMDQSSPQFGKLTIWGGIGQYSQNSSLQGYGSANSQSPISPTLRLNGQLWLNPEWFFEADIMQSALTLSNPIDSDSPSNLSTTLSSYTLSGGYIWLLGSDFFGPKIQVSGGLHQWVSDPARSDRVVYTKMQFGGLYLGFDGSFGVSPGSAWDFGSKFKLFLTQTLSESPKSGNSSSESLLDFSIYTRYRKSLRMSYLGELNFQNYGAQFSGATSRPDPATKTTHKNTLFMFGIEYAF